MFILDSKNFDIEDQYRQALVPRLNTVEHITERRVGTQGLSYLFTHQGMMVPAKITHKARNESESRGE